MTTTRRNTTPKGLALGIDLTTYCAQMDEHTGREPGTVEAAVRAYRAGSDLAALTNSKSEARKEINRKLERFIELGGGHEKIGNGRLVKRSRGGGTRVSVTSANVQKMHPKLWAASKISTRVAVVKAPAAQAGYRLPSLSFAKDALAAYEQIKELSSGADRQVKAARAELAAVFDEVGDAWDGTPMATTDGWVLGWNPQERFNEKRCWAVAQEWGIDLSPITSVTQAAPYAVYVLDDTVPYGEELADYGAD